MKRGEKLEKKGRIAIRRMKQHSKRTVQHSTAHVQHSTVITRTRHYAGSIGEVLAVVLAVGREVKGGLSDV